MMDAETRARKLHHQRELSAIKKAERREHLASRPAKVATGGGKLSGSPGEATERKAIPLSWMRKVWTLHSGLCAHCSTPLPMRGPEIEYDHCVPIALGGIHHPANLYPMCPTCHLEKTRADVRNIAKAKRIAKKHFEGRKPSRMKSRGFS